MELKQLVGVELAGFELTDLLGEGGMAVVFRGENLLNRKIERAVKIVRPELSDRPEFAARFAEEALTLERLAHPNIVRFYGLRTVPMDGHRMLLMELELLDGEPLSRAMRRTTKHLAIVDVVRWMVMACRGVAAAHAMGVVHRDLKPDNLFLAKDGVIRVLDFGIARAVDEADRALKLTIAGTVPGSPPYMAPEVCNGQVPTAAADVYALGITLCELLFGYHPYVPPGEPFQSSTQLMFAHVSKPVPQIREIRRDAPPQLDEVVRRACAKTPAERYATAAELCAALEGVLAQLDTSVGNGARADISTQFAVPSLSSQVSTTAPMSIAVSSEVDATVAPRSRSPILAIALGGGVLALGGVAALVLMQSGPAQEPTPAPEVHVAATAPVEEAVDEPPAAPPLANEWVQITPQMGQRRVWDDYRGDYVTRDVPVAMGIESDRASSSVRGFRPRRGITAPTTPYAIQAHEVTWSELDRFLEASPEHEFERPSWVPAEPAERRSLPATGVPWDVARRYCLSLGGSLPTEEQWEYAARGAERRPYSWGNARIDLSRTRAFGGPDGRVVQVMTNDQDRTPGVSGQSIWDMQGNALEWTIDIFRDDLPDQDESWAQAGTTSFRAVRGLSPHGAAPHPLPAEGAAYRDALCATGECPPATNEILQHVGFRCVR